MAAVEKHDPMLALKKSSFCPQSNRLWLHLVLRGSDKPNILFLWLWAMQLKSKKVAQDSLHIWVRVFIEQHGGFVVEDRRRKTAQKVGYIWERVVCLEYHTKDVQLRSKNRPSFTFLKLPLAKNLEILEKREKWKERQYQPRGRRHCNPASKAAWLPVTSSCPCPAHMPRCTCPGHPGLCGSDCSPLLRAPPRGWVMA